MVVDSRLIARSLQNKVPPSEALRFVFDRQITAGTNSFDGDLFELQDLPGAGRLVVVVKALAQFLIPPPFLRAFFDKAREALGRQAKFDRIEPTAVLPRLCLRTSGALRVGAVGGEFARRNRVCRRGLLGGRGWALPRGRRLRSRAVLASYVAERPG